MKTLVSLIFSLFLLSVSGCAPGSFSSEISRFHEALPPGNGVTTFTILPDEQQKGSLEFETYAQHVATQMNILGYRPVPASVAADLVVQFRYGIRGSYTTVATEPTTTVGFGSGMGSGYYGRGWGWGYGMAVPLSTRTTTTTVYTHFVDLTIYRGADFRRDTRLRVFEGHAFSDRTSQALPYVVPFLIRALFTDFPGRNGETLTISVPLDPS